MSDPSYNYTVIWTNLSTGVMDSSTVPEDTNSYTVTGLSDNDNYNVSITAVGVCGMITSDPITVYGKNIHICTYVAMCLHNFLAVIKFVFVYAILSSYICIFGSPSAGPNEPQFEYCISYDNGQPALQVISHVRMHLLLHCTLT